MTPGHGVADVGYDDDFMLFAYTYDKAARNDGPTTDANNQLSGPTYSYDSL
jgi:hypothetical protein